LQDVNNATPEARAVIIDVPAAYSRPPRQAVIRGYSKVTFAGRSTQAFALDVDAAERTPLPEAEARSPIELAREELKKVRSIPGTTCATATPGIRSTEAL
jgi:hypothetical protein